MVPPKEQAASVNHDEVIGEPITSTRLGRHIRLSKVNPDEGYQFTEVQMKYRSVTEYIHAQTAYINSMATYSEFNAASQHAIEHLILTQVAMKKVMKLWGEKGVEAIMKEMQQFHNRNIVKPLLPKKITAEIRHKALSYLISLKMKRNGGIKGRDVPIEDRR